MTPQFTELKVDPSYQSNFPFFFFLSFITDRYSRNPGLISHNVCVSAVVRFRSRVLSPKPNVERRYKLWATRHRTIAETLCCGLFHSVNCPCSFIMYLLFSQSVSSILSPRNFTALFPSCVTKMSRALKLHFIFPFKSVFFTSNSP